MRGNLNIDISRSSSSHFLNDIELKKLFPFTQQLHNRYLQQNRLQNIKDDLTNLQQQTITFQIKDLLFKDKTRSRNNIDDIINQQTTPRRLRSKERTISVNKKSTQTINYHDAQNVNLHNKSIRRDIVQLAQWLELMIQQVQQTQGNLSFQDYYNKIEVIFSGSMLELQRQLQQKGFEFGQCLKKIWDSFLINVQYVVEGLNVKANQIEQQSLDKINKLHEWYQEAMQKQLHQIQQQKEELIQMQSINLQMNKENQYLRKKDVRREKQLRELIYDKDHYLLEIIELKSTQFANSMDIEQCQQKIYDYFKKQCENHMKTMEIQYKNLQVQDFYFEHTLDLVIKEKGCQVIDLIKVQDQYTSTCENQLVNVSTQTHKQKRQIDQEVQVKVYTSDQETQVNIYQIKRDKLIRNPYEQIILRNANLDLDDIIDQFQQFYFPYQELLSNDPHYLTLIINETNRQEKQINQILDTINVRNEIAPNDFLKFKEYLKNINKLAQQNYIQIWKIVLNQQSSVIDSTIEKQELQVELDEIKSIFNKNMQIIKQFQNKYEEDKKISQFYQQSLIRIIRYAPQFIINQIQQQANLLKVLDGVEFKELRKKTTIVDSRISVSPQRDDSQQLYSKQSPIRASQISFQSQLQINSMKQISTNSKQLKSQKSFEIEVDMPKGLRDIDEESYKSESEDENQQEMEENTFSLLRFDFSTQKPQLTLEKKLRINTCPLKSAQYSTSILKQILKKFKKSNMNGLYTIGTLLQHYTELIQRQLPNNTNTPLHVHLYEHITFRFGQSQISDCNRYKRIIKSFLYYEHRHSTCKIVVRFLKAELDVQDLNTYLQILEICKEYPSLTFFNFMQSLQEWLNQNHYTENEIDMIKDQLYLSDLAYLQNNPSPTEFDLIMDHFLTIFAKFKNRTSYKYKYLFESIDTQNKGIINFQQWNFIYETIIQVNYSFSVKLFYSEADYQDNQKLMSKQRFTVVSDELQIFQPDQQEKLLDHQNFEDILLELKEKWIQNKIQMKICFIKSNRYDKFIKSLFQYVDRCLLNKLNVESCCFTYKLLQKTYKVYYLDQQVQGFIITPFQIITMKVKQIKEILDKFKQKYSMDMDYKKDENNFTCYFKINSLKIAKGQGSCKKYAKNDAAAKAYDILLNSDYSFAKKTGIKKLSSDEDYKAKLEQHAKEKNIQLKFSSKVEKQNELCYSKFKIEYGYKKFKGFGQKSKENQCFQYMCYNILKQLEYIEKQDQQKKKEINSEQEVIPNKIKIVVKTKQEEPKQIKSNLQFLQPNINQFIEQLKIQQFLNSLMVEDDVYNHFDKFISLMSSQNDFYFRPVGSFTTKSIRTLKPELDILVHIPKGKFPMFEQFLEKTSKEFQSKFCRNRKQFRFELPFQSRNKFLRWTFTSIKANLYIKKKLTPDAFIHDEYMKQYQVEYQQNRYSTQYLSLIHQWREDSKLPLQSKILDYLIVQVSNLFQSLNPPIQVLKQIIYLLKVGVLDEIVEMDKEENELNPFLQLIPQNQIQYIKKLSDKTRSSIKEIAQSYDEKTIQKWIFNYIN
ncbi:unnamed protein product [Paramecium sonneborni]|uniref:DRBM domain-containing protein n=1 Tax=Paramecium sonneborni TaxID=65129 RepID=A0A8S1R9G8_9CILI|nr:unnamed protein product [Paramecium sonneborni]